VDGQLKQDYLLISNLPNLFNRASFEGDHPIINFGGTHVAGTLAVSALFRDEVSIGVLRDRVMKLSEGERGPLYWQALVLVNIKPDHANESADVSIAKVERVEKVMVNRQLLEQELEQNLRYLKMDGLGQPPGSA
jgi:hypothetical protein